MIIFPISHYCLSLSTMMRYKKLMLVGPLPPPATGQSVSFDMLVKGVTDKAIDGYVVNLSRREASSASRFSWRRAKEMTGVCASFARGLWRGYDNVYITIAQSAAGFVRDCIMVWLARLFSAHIVVHLKGGNYGGFYHSQGFLMRFLVRKTLLQVDVILVLGEGLRQMYDFEPALRDKIYVVPNGLPIEFEGLSKSLPAPGKAINILYLSNLIESKGIFDLLAAIRQLKHQYGISISAVFAGKFLASSDDQLVSSADDLESRFFSLRKEYQIEDSVQYVGEVSGDAKWQLLKNSHFFVLPTNYVNEGQPVSIIEAMAYGCPVISTHFRAIPDLVVDGETGVLIEYGDVDKMSLRLFELATDPKRYQAMSQAAMRRYQSHFTMQAHLDRILPRLVGAEEG